MRQIAFVLFAVAVAAGNAVSGVAAEPISAPLVIGEQLTIESAVLGESRRINVYFPYDYSRESRTPLSVMYMPDGGLMEDFLHVAGVLQVSMGNRTIRPFILVGIENTQRRRDLTGPTAVEEDLAIAPEVGGSAAYRSFLRDELMPVIRARYPTTDESGIIGESLAGLFVVETFLLEPGLFQHYIAIDPSLWWNADQQVKQADELLRATTHAGKSLFLAASNQVQIRSLTADLAKIIRSKQDLGLRFEHVELAEESHSTVYHPAALIAVRRLLAPTSIP